MPPMKASAQIKAQLLLECLHNQLTITLSVGLDHASSTIHPLLVVIRSLF